MTYKLVVSVAFSNNNIDERAVVAFEFIGLSVKDSRSETCPTSPEGTTEPAPLCVSAGTHELVPNFIVKQSVYTGL